MYSHQATEKSLSREKELFDTICELAIKQKKEELQSKIQSGWDINILIEKDTPISFLAKQNKSDAVKFLVKEFKVEVDSALEGAIEASNKPLIDFLLDKSASLQTGVSYAAYIGNIEITYYLLKVAEGKKYYKALVNTALMSAAFGKKTEIINSLLSLARRIDFNLMAISLYLGLREQSDILKVSSHINDKKLRIFFLTEAMDRHNVDKKEYKAYIKTSNKLNELIMKNDLTFEQASQYLQTKAHAWLFYGRSLVEKVAMPRDIYFLIAADIINSNNPIDVKKITTVANQRLADRMIDAFDSKNKAKKIIGYFFKNKESRYMQKREKFVCEQKEKLQSRLSF
jgi:hypothetical protein